MKIPTKTFGSTNLQLSIMGLGTVKFGRNQKVKNKSGDGFPLPSDQELHQLLLTASDLGINYLDTAPAYGLAEETIGRLLRDHEDYSFQICTKVGEEFDGELSRYCFDYSYILESVDRSRQRTGADSLAIVWAHLPRNDLDTLKNTDVLRALQDIKEMGHAAAIGVSTHTIEGGLFGVNHTDGAMVSFNSNYTSEKAVIDYANERGKGIVVKKALQQGYLDQGQTPQSCLSYVLNTPGVSSIVFGTLNRNHLRDNLSPFSDAAS